ncbi:MAG: DNA repair protein RecO [Candidatus Omnitrophica bacterium]|nr:DNA repair protein RecO [Candidatus Omnitrophota bacterium]
MPAQSLEGIILRKYYLRETSFILVIFTKEFGKIKGVIKGVRDPYPQFAGNFEPFTRCRFLFYKKKKQQMDLITHCETLDYFSSVKKDIERLTYANYFIELVDIAAADNDENIQLFNVLLDCLKLLGGTSSPRRISRIFELKFLRAIGLDPELDSCVSCGSAIDKGCKFSFKEGGALCPKCLGEDKKPYMDVSLGTVNFLRRIQKSELNRTEHVKVSREVGKEIEKLLRDFLEYHIARSVKSLKFLDRLERDGILKVG